MKIFLSAGEASGDIHAAGLMTELAKLVPGVEFSFLGGDEMARAAGHAPIIHIRQMAFMGFTEVLKNLNKIFSNLSTARRAIIDTHPDAVILVDYPGFNMKLAREAARRGIPVFYYIAPKVWAWKEWRVKSLKRYVTKILSILPFEPSWFASRGVDAAYVGNPSVEEINSRLRPTEREDILALVPGSRLAEIKSNLPVMATVARRHPALRPVIAPAPGIDASVYAAICDFPLHPGPAIELMQMSRAAMVTSGTAVLECALTRTPQVALYRSNGLKIAYDIFKHVLKIPFVTLPNLISGKMIVPELLVHHCNPAELGRALTPLLFPSPELSTQLSDYEEMARSLATPVNASQAAAREVVSLLKA